MSDASSLPLAAQFAACSAEARSLAALGEAQGRWRPAPDRWSVAECLAHLAKTARQYEPGLLAAVRAARARARRAPPGGAAFRPGWFGRRMVATMEPVEAGRGRLKAPASFAPPGGVTLAHAARAFEESQAMLDGVLAAADGFDLRSARLRSPVTPLLRLSLGTALAMLAAHERRHLAQARRVVEAPGFPVA